MHSDRGLTNGFRCLLLGGRHQFRCLKGATATAAKAEYAEASTSCVKADPVKVGLAPRCPVCDGFVGMLEWLPPWRVELATEGRVYGDIVGMDPPNLLVSERFRRLWEASGMRGVGVSDDEVDVVSVRHYGGHVSGDRPKYYRAAAAQSRAAVDHRASRYEWIEDPPKCHWCLLAPAKRWKRIVIDTTGWEGDDLFLPRGGGKIMATERFADWCTQNGIRNAVTVPAVEFAYDWHPAQ